MTEKEKVRQDIKSYEGNKRLRRLSTLGALGSAGTMVVGGYKKSKPLLAGGALGAFLSGFTRGHAKREEKASLNRIKKFYDLREKTATVGSGIDVAGTAVGTALQQAGISNPLSSGTTHALAVALTPLLGPYAPLVAGAIPLGVDYATIPRIGKGYTESLRHHAHAIMKENLGLPLTLQEEMLANAARENITKSKKIDAMKEPKRIRLGFTDKIKSPFWKGFFPKSVPVPFTGAMKDLKTHHHGVFGGAASTGGQLGQFLNPAIKKINEYSPTLASKVVAAIKDNAKAEDLKSHIEGMLGTYGKAVDTVTEAAKKIPGISGAGGAIGTDIKKHISEVLENPNVAIDWSNKLVDLIKKYSDAGNDVSRLVEEIIDTIPGMRSLLRLMGKEGGSFAKEVAKDPKKLVLLLESALEVIKKGMRGGKAGLIGLGLAGVGSLIGKYRKRHPLAKDELPGQLARKKVANILNPQMSTKSVTAAVPPTPPQPAPANVSAPNS